MRNLLLLSIVVPCVAMASPRFVFFGESQHRVVENHRFAQALFKELVAKQGFRTLAIEASWRLGDLLERYEKTGQLDATGPELKFFSGNFYSRELVDIFRDARDWNVAHPNDRVRITGVQPESPVSDLRELTAVDGVRNRCGVAATLQNDLAFAYYAAARRAKQGSYFVGDQAARCREAIDGVAKRARAGFRPQAAILGLYLEFVDLQPALDALTTKPEKSIETLREAYAAIDRRRLALFQLMNLDRAMLWMHGWHTARRADLIDSQGAGVPPVGTVSIGVLLDRLYHKDILSIGSVTYDATVKYDSPDYIEPALLALTGGKITRLPTKEHAAFFRAHPRAGADEGTYAAAFDQAAQFDEVVFFPTLNRVRPPRQRVDRGEHQREVPRFAFDIFGEERGREE